MSTALDMSPQEYRGRERRNVEHFNDTQKIATLLAEVDAIHRENAARDIVIRGMAADIKALLALANQSRGGFWVGMSVASVIGSILTYLATHTLFK